VIRLPSPAEVDREVDAENASWRTRAAARTAAVISAGAYTRGAPDWSEIKPAFMRLQRIKCAYCERPLETAHELDVEHFRPKQKTIAWGGHPTGRPEGYYWLAWDVRNYAVACKPCNSGLKADRFPIAGAPGSPTMTPGALDASEQPLLVFPYSEDPEQSIGWVGTTPRGKDRRGAATIRFFKLRKRPELLRQRRDQLILLWHTGLDKATDPTRPADTRAAALAVAQRWLNDPRNPMLACQRAFAALAQTDRALAERLIESLELGRRR
jgi:hypothetical protein